MLMAREWRDFGGLAKKLSPLRSVSSLLALAELRSAAALWLLSTPVAQSLDTCHFSFDLHFF